MWDWVYAPVPSIEIFQINLCVISFHPSSCSYIPNASCLLFIGGLNNRNNIMWSVQSVKHLIILAWFNPIHFEEIWFFMASVIWADREVLRKKNCESFSFEVCHPLVLSKYQDQYKMFIYRQNKIIIISSVLAIYYIRHNHMFRPLMLAIFRLYMDLPSTYTTCVGCFLGVGKGSFWWDRDLICVNGGCMVWNST